MQVTHHHSYGQMNVSERGIGYSHDVARVISYLGGEPRDNTWKKIEYEIGKRRQNFAREDLDYIPAVPTGETLLPR